MQQGHFRAHRNPQKAAANDEHFVVHGGRQDDATDLKHDAGCCHGELAASLAVEVGCMHALRHHAGNHASALTLQLDMRTVGKPQE